METAFFRARSHLLPICTPSGTQLRPVLQDAIEDAHGTGPRTPYRVCAPASKAGLADVAAAMIPKRSTPMTREAYVEGRVERTDEL